MVIRLGNSREFLDLFHGSCALHAKPAKQTTIVCVELETKANLKPRKQTQSPVFKSCVHHLQPFCDCVLPVALVLTCNGNITHPSVNVDSSICGTPVPRQRAQPLCTHSSEECKYQ